MIIGLYVTNIDLKKGQIVINKKHRIAMSINAMYDAYNILAAYAVGKIFGVDEKKIVSTLTEYANNNNNKIQKRNPNGCMVTFLKSKFDNSISYNQSLTYIANLKEDCEVIISIDDMNYLDEVGNTSWIWDIDFEILNMDCVKKIVLTGKYVNELSVRVMNSELDMKKISIMNQLDDVIKEVKESTNKKIYIVACSADLMKSLNRR
ncbi:MAG: DUF1727 domain-containing protein [Clostridia bacterium]|nr:DUF1727 domain-containing protein [Clostridia bacterium]